MRNQLFLEGFVFVILLIGTAIFLSNFVYSFNKYKEYSQTTTEPHYNSIPYYTWNDGKIFNLYLIVLLFLWNFYASYFIQKTIYPFLKEKLVYKDIKIYTRSLFHSLYKIIYSMVLGYFSRVNHKIKVKIPLWFMKIETFEHVNLLTKIFTRMVLLLSIIYSGIIFVFFGLFPLGSVLLGMLMFFYSNFVPDLPAIFRRKKSCFKERDILNDKFSKIKSYALLLFIPMFIFLIFCGKKIKWKTSETFHNFKSLAFYGTFITSLGVFMLIIFQNSAVATIEVIWVLSLSLLGYLTHLKVDEVF